MPDRLEERVRRALESTIRIVEKIGEGGMGVVYRGTHLQLQVDVAVKVLRPENAGAETIERFRREAQVMARFHHFNIIRILDLPSPDLVDGLHLFVMQYIEGQPLADRLLKERLKPEDGLELGKQLLRALREVHRHRVVHRDVKPGNVVFDSIRGGWVLVDFGIAKVLDTPTLTAPGTALGTREYLPPDQAEWADPTPQLDVYAAAATIYEAYTAEPWNPSTSPTSAGWSQIPSVQAKALRKAIAPVKERWQSAEEFLRAFTRRVVPPWVYLVAAVVAGVAYYLIRTLPILIPLGWQGAATTEIAGQATAGDVSRSVTADLSAVLDTDPRTGIDCHRPPIFHRLVNCAEGVLTRLAPDSLQVGLVFHSGSSRHVVNIGPERDKDILAGRIAAEVLALTGHQPVVETCRLSTVPTPNTFLACREFLAGQDLFSAGDWSGAVKHFKEAIDLNPALADAIWLLYFAEGWRREPIDTSLIRKIHEHLEQLSEVHRLLFDAQTTALGADRNAKFERVIQRFPLERMPYLLYGSELFHRGALLGIPLDSSAAVLRSAIGVDSSVTEAYDQLLWVLIRLGNKAGTDSVLNAYPSAHRGALFKALSIARQIRFDPSKVLDEFKKLDEADTAVQRVLRQTYRFGPSLDIPQGEAWLAREYSASGDPGTRADGYEGLAIAELIQGLVEPGLAHADSAGFGDIGAVEQAEWRVMFSGLGVWKLSDQERDRARERLRPMARSTGGLAARAAWSLAIDAYLSGDSKSGATWEAILASQTARDTVLRLSSLLGAVKAGAKGSYQDALRLSQGSLALDEAPLLVDPFSRTVLHLLRGRWALALSDTALARREWRWSDNADIQGWSTGPAQAAEVDWVAGSYARVLRAQLNHCTGIARADTVLALADASRFPAVDSAKACHA